MTIDLIVSPQNSYTEALFAFSISEGKYSVIIFGDRTFKEVIKTK